MYGAYPADPVELPAPALSGGTVTAANAVLTVPPTASKNPFWQALNKRLGVTLDIQMVPSGGFAAKFATMVAGGDLPDLLPVMPRATSNYVQLLESQFEDLTPYLGGDAAADYPNLAAIPTAAWEAVSVNGKIYNVPEAVPAVSSIPAVRLDIFEQLGLTTEPADGKEFLGLCDALTDEKAGRWAFGSIPQVALMVHDMAEVPNQWRVENGKFTSQYATDEYKDFLTIMASLWEAGYFEPDAATAPGSQWNAWFAGGRTAIQDSGYLSWASRVKQAIPDNPDFKIGGLVTPKWSGGGQSTYSQGSQGRRQAAVKKNSASKIKNVLGVLNYLASPFGSTDQLFRAYGIAGRDYTLQGSDPVETKTGISECVAMNFNYLVSDLAPIYLAGQAEMAKAEQEFMVKLAKKSAPLPTAGIISQTELGKGAAPLKKLSDLQNDIILGRKSISSWDGGVKEWLSSVGSKIGREYEEGYASKKSE